ncbi:hypothetical protein GCM10023310_51350 [Paenibacillus vulneris]
MRFFSRRKANAYNNAAKSDQKQKPLVYVRFYNIIRQFSTKLLTPMAKRRNIKSVNLTCKKKSRRRESPFF